MVLGVIGLDVEPVIAGAGLIGIALAFGAQSLIKDLFNGVLILLEDHFGIGDEIQLGEATGVVERMTLRETVLRDVNGTVWHVRNGEIDKVGNFSQVWSVALVESPSSTAPMWQPHGRGCWRRRARSRRVRRSPLTSSESRRSSGCKRWTPKGSRCGCW